MIEFPSYNHLMFMLNINFFTWNNLMPILNDPFSFTYSTGFIRFFLSIKLMAFCSGPVICILLEISLSVMILTRFIRYSPSINIVTFCSFSLLESSSHSLLFSLFSYVPCTHIHPILFPSIRRKPGSVWVCRTLWYFGLTFCS
jgi:hypothetical protein